jgi:4'-phosphopantetheinyl transferase EntD
MSPVRMPDSHTPAPACAHALAALLPATVHWQAAWIADGPLPPLAAAEEPAVARAVESRRREFAVGRACARAALAALGQAAVAIPADAQRAPLWPEGVVGTLSHDPQWCVAAVARRADCGGLGLDVEGLARFKPGMARLVATAAEHTRWLQPVVPGALASAEQEPPALKLARLFSAKEAMFKALHPTLRAWIGFDDAELLSLPDGGTGPFSARLLRAFGPLPAGQTVQGHSVVAAGRVLSVVVLSAGFFG